MRAMLWAAALALATWPVVAAALSPYTGGRDLIWNVGSMSGIVVLSLLLIQPLLTLGSGPRMTRAIRMVHRVLGLAIAALVVLHVGALYSYSPDDIWDALILVAPTPFSVYGVIGLWTVLLTVALALARNRLSLRYSHWRILHSALAVLIVASSAIHALMIEGLMEETSKLVVAIAALAATTIAVVEINVLSPMRLRRGQVRTKVR